MTKQLIRTVPDPILRTKSEEVKQVRPYHRRFIEKMKRIMLAAGGVGLAAPQIGVPIRIIIASVDDKKVLGLINPVIVQAKGRALSFEGCLSIPGVKGIVERARTIDVKALDEDGNPVRFTTGGLLATIIQHEVDHLDGILFTDKTVSTLLQMSRV